MSGIGAAVTPVLAYNKAAIIDPPEARGMAVGAGIGLTAGLVVSGAVALSEAAENARRAQRGLSRLDHPGVMGMLGLAVGGGLAIGIVGGYLVGHVQDEGWTIPGVE